MTRKVAVYNQKGGVGKSTTTANLAAALSDQGHRVLAIDADKQANLTAMLGASPGGVQASTVGLFTGAADLSGCATAVPDPEGHGRLELVAADPELATVEFNLASAMSREEILSRSLEGQLDDYDWVLIDCPPNQGLLSVNACVLAEEVVVPVRMVDPHSVSGVGDLLGFLDQLRRVGWERPIRSMLPLDVDPRLDVYANLQADLEASGLPLSDVRVPRRTAVQKAILMQQPVVWWDPRSDASAAYRDYASELTLVTTAEAA